MGMKTTRPIETRIPHTTAISCYTVIISYTHIAGHLPVCPFVQAAAEPAATRMQIGIAAVSDKRCWPNKIMTYIVVL
jgi:hypothetical protein